MTKLKGDANGNTIFRKDSLGRKIACMNCINNHRSSNCLPSHNDDVRVVDGVGRKKGSKNLPKDSQKAKHKVKKPACPQKGSQGRILPLQNLQLRNIVQVQPAISRQAGAFLQQDIFGALPQANNVHSQPVVNDMHAHPRACNSSDQDGIMGLVSEMAKVSLGLKVDGGT
ncbi:hypothetical protein HG531_000991 [Fusarium graminearum]|nr:hypothetical protein HG531_000991 [Fusarium graminearum]